MHVLMTTSAGDIVLELNQDKAPISVENFLKYAQDKHYDGTIFHRVIDDFMIQGGGFTADMKQKPTRKPIKNEWQNGLKNVKYSVAMARTSVPDSATSQFYINVKDNPFLDDGSRGAAYAVFGRVVAGMDVVDRIKGVQTGERNGMGDVPVQAVEIQSVRALSDQDAAKYTAGHR